MKNATHHEEIYRGTDALKTLKKSSVLVCGCGALGSNLLDALARQGIANLGTIDFDRVEEHNIGTQRFDRQDIGALKVAAMEAHLYHSMQVTLVHSKAKLEANNRKKLLGGYDLVVDCFDNTEARELVQLNARLSGNSTVHAGLFENYGEVVWDENYNVPKDSKGDVCDYPLARNIIMMTVTVLSEVIVDFLISKRRRNFAITLKDLKVTETPYSSKRTTGPFST